ncbi:MAG: hypothetical protein UT32_C0001G0134 [Parcubacteria group bacterium GW2011_GWC2_39_14]|nr:MAG: hypothetical protein UT32_C0001G0134 [Parcubacteria group bacterium GW2011_GWC2_39_14]KKR55558.1 MAG: hypothetical protein UT91_C0001G0133 [Parcubacteria group bacterium GW2011_GWA2_40_23]
MKIISFLCLFAVLGFVFVPGVSANQPTAVKSPTQDFLENKAAIIEPGVLPTSFWYWADKFAEQIRFVFTVGKEGKADYLVGMAKERLAEMKKLSEEGITKYADGLLVEHDELIKKAQEMYLDLKEQGIEKAKELQVGTEKNILINEAKIKSQLGNAETTYKVKEDSVGAKVRAFLGTVMSHLSWKNEQIQGQRADTFDK